MEEIVAEMGACFIASGLDIAPEPRDQNIAYIQEWLKVLKKDNRAIFAAAGHAQKAADFLHVLQPGPEPQHDNA